MEEIIVSQASPVLRAGVSRRVLLACVAGAIELATILNRAAWADGTSAGAVGGPSSQARSEKDTAMTVLEHPAPRRLVRGDINIIYYVQGSGPTIVLIPSLGRGAEDFDVLAVGLAAAGFRVLRPEPRGFAGSTPLRDGETLHDMARDIAAVIEAEKAGPAIVAGHAAGNWQARVLARDRPDLVRAVALLAAIVGGEAPSEIRASITGSFDPALPHQSVCATSPAPILRRAPMPASGWKAGAPMWPPPSAPRLAQRSTSPGFPSLIYTRPSISALRRM